MITEAVLEIRQRFDFKFKYYHLPNAYTIDRKQMAWKNEFFINLILSPFGEPLMHEKTIGETATGKPGGSGKKPPNQALSGRESLFQAVLESANDCIFLKDRNLRYVMANAAMGRLFERPIKDLIGKTDDDLFGAMAADEIKKADKEVLTGKTIEAEITKPVNGKSHIFHTKKTPVRDADGSVSGICGIARDITEQKSAEKALRESEERYRQIFNIASAGIYEVDFRTGKFIDANDAICEYSGYSRDELLAMDAINLLTPESQERFKNRLARAFNGEGLTETVDYEILKKDGSSSWIGLNNRYLYEEGQIVGATVIARDITETKKMEIHREKLEKMDTIGALAAGIAHDFNNILFPIIGLSEILTDDLPPGSQEFESAQEILEAGKRGSNLVKQILTFSRQTDKQMMPARIENVLREVAKLCRSTIPANIHISMDIQNGCGLVMADTTQLHQVAMNLITNASHAVGETDGEVSIRLEERDLSGDMSRGNTIIPAGRYAVLTISDNGCGIGPEVQDKIFEPYFTTKKIGKGTGLGLSVVHGIVREHGGHIALASTPGKGTRFEIFLPVIMEEMDSSASKKPEYSPTGNERILLVDDEKAVVRLEKQILERLDYRVTPYASSVEALTAFRADPQAFDLVLTDMTMPKMTGIQLARELVAVRPDIPVIICTGFSETLTHEKAEEIGIKGVLMKPVAKSAMAKMVRGILDQSKRPDRP